METAERPPVAPKKRGGLTPPFVIAATIAIFFAAQIIGTFILLIYPVISGWSQTKISDWLESSTAAQFILVAIIEFLTIFMVVQALRWRRVPLAFIGLVKVRVMDIWRALAGFAVYMPLYIGLYQLMQVILPNIDYEQKQQLGFEGAASSGELALVFVSLVILPPLAEEILVRGFLFSGVRTRMKFLKAALLTSLLFAAAHLQIGSGAPLLWTAALDTFILSLVLCYLREKSGSIWPGVMLHMIKNGLAYVVLFAGR